MLKICNFTKKYGERTVVDNLSLNIAQGEMCAFIGHNGAGKTTTLKACCGIIDFDGGDIYIDGVSVKSDPFACKKKLAYIPDDPQIYEFMSGDKYLNFVADIYGVTTDERRALTEKYGAMLSLTDALTQPVGTYSHGMKQKLAIIAAMIHSPSLIIMDEPFVGLDPKASHTLKGLMHDFCRDGGAIFFSTHVLDVAERLCDHVAVIRKGKLVKYGSMDEVRKDASLEAVFLELEGENVTSADS